ncbi:family 78 glycoside hydrolase catalytic domain [Lachnospiraceae bacterium 29-91]
MLHIKDFRMEYQKNPLGMDAPNPRFSWKLQSDRKNTVQASYHIAVRNGSELVWDSGIVETDTSICVKYPGTDQGIGSKRSIGAAAESLKPQARYEVKVEVTDNHGEDASAEGWFETGLMGAGQWKADWITHGFEDDLEPCAVFIKRFHSEKEIAKARLYASALGIYEFTVNGRPGSDIHFAPGWTSYQERIQYQTYDVAELLGEENELRFVVGNGWYKGILGFFNQGDHYGKRTALIAQLEITYTDGTIEKIVTDESWETTTGAHRYSEIYHGEVIDYRFEKESKLKAADAGTNTASKETVDPAVLEIRPARRIEQSKEVLTAQQDEPVRITERRPGEKLIHTPKGEVVIDFGQNLTGVVEVKLCKKRGTKVVIRHAEALDENGNFYTVNLRTAKATDTFICSGEEDLFRPMFTYHGFRYIQVEGLGEDVDPKDFTACVLHTDLEKTGSFTCSNEAVNRLAQNIDWGLRDNFLDIPTDCPQRDERLGYTGDAQIFLSTAACCRNVALFFEKWLQDLKYEQSLGAGIPTTVPNILGPGGGIAIWHDAAAIIPWTLYQNYGDRTFLEEQFDSMVSCVEYSRSLTGEDGLIKTGQQLGDWVSMDVPRGPMLKRTEEVWNLELIEKMGSTDPYFVANVYYAYSTSLAAQAAKVLGKEEEAEKYRKQHEEILEKIRDEYITKNGRLVSETQTGCVLALQFDIAEKKHRAGIFEALKQNLRQHKNHLTTGFAGTPFLCPVLSENGAHDLAGNVFLKEDCPSWLYHVKLGATTMWELWDGVNPDGSFNKFEMNSLNHYSYGSIGGWMYHDLLGLDILEPGYKKSRIAPRLIKGIPEMKGSIETVYGTLGCEISCVDHKYVADITIPENTTAVVSLPDREEEVLGSGRYHYEYETEDAFEKERYDYDSLFGELIEDPIGNRLLNQYAKELMENEMFLMFAKDHPITDISGMLPPEAMGLIDMVIAQCNKESIRRPK